MNDFERFLYDNNYYNYDNVEELLNLKKYFRYTLNISAKKEKRIYYYEIPASLDIETSSFYDSENRKTSIMYIWMYGIYGKVFIGRTWEQLLLFYNSIIDIFNISLDFRLITYVQFLDFEFQFMRLYFNWHDVFAIGNTLYDTDRGKPLTATTIDGIEFRCSLKLSGLSLQKMGENLMRYKGIVKKSGDLDYRKIRHSETPLTKKEIGYCINDVKVVMAFIAEEIIKNRTITKIPLTSTGYTRTHCRNSCFYETGKKKGKSKKKLQYQDLIKGLKLTLNEYLQLKNAFQGGFTHGNALYIGEILEHIFSLDFTSSYPAVLIAEKFPMSMAEEIVIKDKADFEKNLALYCCLFDIEFTNIRSKYQNDFYISESRCVRLIDKVVFNGRVQKAKILSTTITEVDYEIINARYYFDSIKITNFRRYKKAYLPKDFILSILELYKKKTELKGVKGKEEEYMYYKALLNACYGMAVTSILRNIPIYKDNHWLSKKEKEGLRDDIKTIQDYNNDKNRFLFYPWGVWVTAYARRNLFTALMECGNDYVYSDTDSVKIFNYENHKFYFEKYNELIIKQLKVALDYHKIPYSYILPKNKKGIIKPLGVWEFEGEYTYFKTLGAKRYMTYKDGILSITVSGLNKKIVVPWLLSTGVNNYYYLTDEKIKECFERFSDTLYVPAGYTGKSVHAYIDEERQGIIKDYLGNYEKYSQKSGIHLEESDYSLSLSETFIDFVLSIRM